MDTAQPFIVEYDKKFDLLKIWNTFYHFHNVTRHPPEVRFLDKAFDVQAIFRGREFVFHVVEGKDSNSNNRPVIGVKIVERVMGMMTELCHVIRFKDSDKVPCSVTLLNGNVVDEKFVKELLQVSEAVIRNHPEYREIN